MARQSTYPESSLDSDNLVTKNRKDETTSYNSPENESYLGTGFSYAHHGEILQGIFDGEDGNLHKGLITLPCPLFHSEAQFMPSTNNQFTCSVPSKWKAIKAAQLVLQKFGHKYKGGELRLNSNIPISWGLGSSTCDVITSIYAVSKSCNIILSKYEVAKLAVEIEVACDSTMFTEEITLFAQREGIVLEKFENGFPKLLILGFNSDPKLSGIDTLSIPAVHYSDNEKEAFSNLLSVFRIALKTQDAKLIGRVSTESAIINQRYLPKPLFNQIMMTAENTKSVGIQISHSGNVMGILFDAAMPFVQSKLNQAKKELSNLGINQTYTFKTS